MKTFLQKQEIRDLLNKVIMDEVSFTRMVEIMNERVSERVSERVDETNEPQFKDGDFVYEDGRVMIFKSYPNNYHCIYFPRNGKPFFDNRYGIDFTAKSFRRATKEEKQELLDALAEEGKRWNAEKLCIEDIPVRKFKKGDKVRIKEGVSSKTHDNIYISFVEDMDDLLGETMTVDRYTDRDNYVACEGIYWHFLEEWLESYDDELKKGDLAIFWDEVRGSAIIKFYKKSNGSEEYFRHKDKNGFNWVNAIRFESKEQYERFIKGEI